MQILYINIRGVIGKTGRAVRACGHNLMLRSGCVEALEIVRNSTFDAVVIEDDNDDPEILRFTVEAHQSRPALPIFVANTWSHGLLRAIEQFGRIGEACGEDDSDFSAAGQADSTSHSTGWDEDSSSFAFSGQENGR
jgi:hypothetical protein